MLAAVALMFGQTTPPETTRRDAARKGPRAIALLELAANGKARLIPITVMYDGKFYDAGSYKASPIPMALQRDTVYEAVRTGVSQGLFTVIGAFHRGNEWVAEGKWEPASATPSKKRPPEPPARRDDDQDKPPVLRRPGSEGRPEDRSESGSETPKPSPPAAPPANAPAATATAPVTTPADPEQSPPDNDRPVLRRGKAIGGTIQQQGRSTASRPRADAQYPCCKDERAKACSADDTGDFRCGRLRAATLQLQREACGRTAASQEDAGPGVRSDSRSRAAASFRRQ